jgi:hypothetical protein
MQDKIRIYGPTESHRSTSMQIYENERIAILEKRQRLSLAVNLVFVVLLVVGVVGELTRTVHAQPKEGEKTLVLSELTIVDSHGVVRARLGGDLPDANKEVPRGSRVAGLLLYVTRLVRNEVGMSPLNHRAT